MIWCDNITQSSVLVAPDSKHKRYIREGKKDESAKAKGNAKAARTERSRTPGAKEETGFNANARRAGTYRRCAPLQETPLRR